MRDADVVAARRMLVTRQGAEGIEPGVQLHAVPVRLGDGKGQRVPLRLGSAAHFPREVGRPRFESGLVERVSGGTRLENEAVQASIMRGLNEATKLLLLARHGQAGLGGPVDAMHGGDPRAAQLARRLRHLRLRGGGASVQQKHGE